MTTTHSTDNNFDFSTLQALITADGVKLHASEVHGVLTGLICGGLAFDEPLNNKQSIPSYLGFIVDLLNNGDNLPASLNKAFTDLYSQIWQALLDESFAFTLLIADDDESLHERAHGLSVWVQGFTLGFGLQQKNSDKLTNDVQEVLGDFIEIANISDDIEEDDDSEHAFLEITEYVKVSALLCFSEYGVKPEQVSNNEKIH